MRPLAIALLLAATLAACGGSGAPDGSAVGTYAISADRLCAQLAGAIRHVFENSPDDPDEAMARYAREVGEAGAALLAGRPAGVAVGAFTAPPSRTSASRRRRCGAPRG